VSLRDLVWDISPSWLRTDFWANLMYSLAIQFDALDVLESYAVRARFPDLARPTRTRTSHRIARSRRATRRRRRPGLSAARSGSIAGRTSDRHGGC